MRMVPFLDPIYESVTEDVLPIRRRIFDKERAFEDDKIFRAMTE